MTQHAVYLQGSLLRHIVTMSVASSIGLVAIFLVDLADMFFISLLGHAELAAAVGYSGAILFFTISISIAMSITCGALVARSLGREDEDRAREQTTHMLIVSLVIAAIVAVCVWLNLDILTGLMGASGSTQDLAIRYLAIIIPSMPFIVVAMVCSAVIRSHGDARLSTWVTLSGGIVNAILDPILIFGLGLGLDGAAVASVCARLVMMAVALRPVLFKYGGLVRLNWTRFRADVGPILGFALPAMLANVATPVGSAYVTRAAAEFGEEAVAGMAIVGRVTPVAFCLIFALSGAIGPIMGQNFGAGKYDRVRRSFLESIYFTIAYVVGAVIILFLLRAPIANMFGAEGVARDLIFLFCGPLSLAWIFNGIIFVGNAAYNNLGHPYYSTSVNWARSTLGVFPFVWVGAYYWGGQGVLIGQMAGGVFVAIFSFWLALLTIRKASLSEGPVKLRTAFSPHRKIFQLYNDRR